MTRMMTRYILKDKEVIEERDMPKWSKWMEEISNRRIALDHLFDGTICVSTVFLGIDQAWFETQEPMVFETMVFDDTKNGDEVPGYTRRYSRYDDALKMHQQIVKSIRENGIRNLEDGDDDLNEQENV